MTLKKGSIASETQFYVVKEVRTNDLVLTTDNKQEIVVTKSYATKHLVSADQFSDEKTVSRTEIIDLFLQSTGVSLTANYNKQVKESDVLDSILSTYQNSTPANLQKNLKKIVKTALEGEERTIKGRHLGGVDSFGRIVFIDMEQEYEVGAKHDARIRLVDPRTINWLIVRDVKYVVK